MADNGFHTFPSTEIEALALLWMQKNDTNGLTPAQFYAKYKEVKDQIKDARRNERAQNISF